MKRSRPGLQTAKKHDISAPNLYIIFDQKGLNLHFSTVELIHVEWFKGGYSGMYTILLNYLTEKKK